MDSTMRAVRRTTNGIETLRVSRPEGPGVRVHMRSAGICGSDVYAAQFGPSPFTIGHEFAGVLDDGTAVAVRPHTSCGNCEFCRRGEHNLCEDGLERFYGTTLDGGMAEEILVVPSALVRIPAAVSVEAAGLIEPISISLHAAHRGGVEAGMRVLVVGGGAIGLTFVMAARALGVEVDVAARHRHQMAAAEALGAGLNVGKRYDVVIDAVGSQAALDESIDRVRKGGTVVEVGGTWEPTAIGAGMMLKEVTIKPAMLSAHHQGVDEFEQSAEILAANPDAPSILITHCFPLERAAEAFAVAGDKSSGAIKVHLHP